MAFKFLWLLCFATPRLAAVAVGLGVLAGTALAAPPVESDLDAVVQYETRQVSKAGVVRVDTWQERMVRRAGVVWTERVLPKGVNIAHVHDTSQAISHRHLNLDNAARWLQRDATGKVDLRFVDHGEKVIVSIPQAEFGTVGFDGKWAAAAYMVPPEMVAKMKPNGNGPNGAVWRVERDKEWSHRVLWSESKHVALQIESSKIDGSFSRTVTVTPSTRGPTLPWTVVAKYEKKDYDDYQD
jgi:hypothetical protein